MAVSGKKIIIGLSLVVLVCAGALVIIPWFLNPAYLKSLALQQIQETFGPYVTVGDTTLTLFPHPYFSVADIVVKEAADSHAVFRAQSMSLELGVGQLLQKKIVVRSFFLDHPEIEVHRHGSGDWRFLGQRHGDSPFTPLAKFLVMGKFIVQNGKVIVIDESPKDTVRGIVVEGVNCSTETSIGDGLVSAQLELSGLLRQNRKSAPFELHGQLDGVLSQSQDTGPSSETMFEGLNFTGGIQARGLEVNHWAEFIPHGSRLATFPHPVDIGTEIKWIQKGSRSQLQLTNVSLDSSSLVLTGNVNFEGLEDGHYMMGGAVHSPNVDLDLVRTYVPSVFIPEPLQVFWSQGTWGGNVEIAEARLIGSSRPDVQTSVAGTFRVQDGYFDLPGWGHTEQVSGTVVMEADRIQLNGGRGVYDSIPVEVTQGVVLLKDTGPWADIEIQGPVPVEKVLAVMKDLPATRGAVRFMKSWTWRQGEGPLRLRFAGNVDGPDGMRFQQGEYHPQAVFVEIPGVPQPVTQVQGTILFGRESTVLDNVQGFYGAHPFAVNGAIVYAQAPRFDGLKVIGVLEGRDVWAIGQPSASEQNNIPIRGPLGVSLTLSGLTEEPKFKGTIEAGNVLIHIPSVFHKEPGQGGTLELEGQVQGNGKVRIDRVEFMLLPIRIQGRGILRIGSTVSFDGRIDSGPIYAGLLPEGVSVLGEYLQSGILEIQLGIRGRGLDWTNWQTRGWVALTEGVVKARGVPHALTNLYVRLKIDRGRLDLKRAEFHIQDSEAVLTGIVDQWMGSPKVSLMMESPKFDVDLLIPKKERSVVRDAVEWLAAHGTLEGSIHVVRPRYHNLTGEQLSASVKIHDNLVSVDKVQMMVEDVGTLDGRFFIHLPAGKPSAIRASFQAKDIPFDKLLILVGDEQRSVSGNLSVRGMVQGHGRHVGGVIPSLNGNLEVTLRQGYVYRGTVLPRILSLLNLPHVLRGKEDFESKGFPFKKVTSTLTIEDGKFSTKDFYLNSSIMKVTAAGSYNLERDQLDGVAAVSPFGAYSDLLKKVPLFGRIFAGDRKGLATAMFSLTGTLEEPKVTYLPTESFKTGISGLAQLAFDILKNTVTMPYELLNGTPGDSSTKESSSEDGVPAPVPSTK
ncbi:MAG: AsmA-like C-terminal domain-containing protein [Nitrospirales bacterium]